MEELYNVQAPVVSQSMRSSTDQQNFISHIYVASVWEFLQVFLGQGARAHGASVNMQFYF